MTSIFVCYTPLHTLIASKIIDEEKINEPVLVYYCRADSATNRHYFQRLAQKTKCAFYVKVGLRISDAPALIKLGASLMKICRRGMPDFYTGNLKSFYTRILMFMVGFRRVSTFDDGSANVTNGTYFMSEAEHRYSRYFFSLFRRRLLYRRLKYTIARHYTIFRVHNIYDYVGAKHYMDLFNRGGRSPSDDPMKPPLTLLLLGTFYEDGFCTLQEERDLYERIMRRFKVTMAVRHPRSTCEKVADGRIVLYEGNLIAEELIGALSRDHAVRVIGVYSTALLNVSALPNVQAVNINHRFASREEEFRDADAVFSQLGVNVCALDDPRHTL